MFRMISMPLVLVTISFGGIHIPNPMTLKTGVEILYNDTNSMDTYNYTFTLDAETYNNSNDLLYYFEEVPISDSYKFPDKSTLTRLTNIVGADSVWSNVSDAPIGFECHAWYWVYVGDRVLDIRSDFTSGYDYTQTDYALLDTLIAIQFNKTVNNLTIPTNLSINESKQNFTIYSINGQKICEVKNIVPSMLHKLKLTSGEYFARSPISSYKFMVR